MAEILSSLPEGRGLGEEFPRVNVLIKLRDCKVMPLGKRCRLYFRQSSFQRQLTKIETAMNFRKQGKDGRLGMASTRNISEAVGEVTGLTAALLLSSLL